MKQIGNITIRVLVKEFTDIAETARVVQQLKQLSSAWLRQHIPWYVPVTSDPVEEFVSENFRRILRAADNDLYLHSYLFNTSRGILIFKIGFTHTKTKRKLERSLQQYITVLETIFNEKNGVKMEQSRDYKRPSKRAPALVIGIGLGAMVFGAGWITGRQPENDKGPHKTEQVSKEKIDLDGPETDPIDTSAEKGLQELRPK